MIDSGEQRSTGVVLFGRIHFLRSSLATVQSALGDIDQCRSSRGASPELRNILEGLCSVVTQSVQNLRDATRNDNRRGNLLDEFNRLEKAEADARDAMTSIRRVSVALDQTTVGDNLGEEVTAQLKILDDIEADLFVAQSRPTEERSDVYRQAWPRYVECNEECSKIFDEYVALMHGVLLRECGVGSDLCRIADDLVKILGHFTDFQWNSVTVPAWREHGDASTARLIRIGFPEWTVWTLPLTAHEFGHVFATRHEKIRPLVSQLGTPPDTTETEIRTWIADAFATATMGPAYVWAATLLRADPRQPLDRRRVAVMFRTLDKMADPGSRLHNAEVRLRGEWDEAILETDNSIALDSPVQIDQVVSAVWNRVPEPRFGIKSWERAKEISDLLRSAEPDEIAHRLVPGDLRELLVAAWIIRLEEMDEGRGDVTAQIKTLGDNVTATAIQLLERPPTGATRGETRIGFAPTSSILSDDKGYADR